MRSKGRTYTQLAEDIGVGESALKQFVKRGQDSGSQPLRRGAAFERIYNYFSASDETPSEPAKDGGDWKAPNLSPFETRPTWAQAMVTAQTADGGREDRMLDVGQRAAIYSLLMKMLGVKGESLESASMKVFGRKEFYCFRNAVTSNFVVVSRIVFEDISSDPRYPIWEFKHHFEDNDASHKETDGVALVMHNNIYLLGDIQRGEGLDLFLIREPLGSEAKFLLGALTSIDDYHQPFVANVVLVDAAEMTRAGGSKLDGESDAPAALPFDGQMIIRKEELEAFEIAGNRQFGRQVAAQLQVEASDTVLRIRKRHFFPGAIHPAGQAKPKG
ncbi:hypothetical protein P1X14_18375 [Sphingomonas sp. AOB5]|uniref:hypothetical protein n=1 Tax=Sphingomonas sp. AOB5 TaxID=3034017 RepID=UPI0023FA0DEE|nr:hypothetical protein [Sphingomonas sp. AOB5]MDF7777232.1 hypothetical protein [Sphingomonas sp. AOB5]